MDEVLVERGAVDAQHPSRGRVDADDVVVRVDDDHADVQPEQDPLGRCGGIGRPTRIASRRTDRAVEWDADFSRRGDHLRPRLWHRLLSGQPSVDPKPRVLFIIRVRQCRHGLREPEDQPSVGPQRIGEGLQRDPLERLGEVDQDVPAEDQVDPREGHPGTQVVLAEDHLRAQRLGDLEGRAGRREIAIAQGRRDARQCPGRVDPTTGERDRRGIDVGREDPDIERRLAVQDLGDRHRQRVGLLARGAARGPDAQLAPLAPGILDRGHGTT